MHKEYYITFDLKSDSVAYTTYQALVEVTILDNGCIDIYLRTKNKDNEFYTFAALYAKIEWSGGIFKKGTKYIQIEDIEIGPEHRNKGFGSILLKSLMDDVYKDNDIHHIYGYLTKFDMEDHGDRLIHFYEKNQFTVTIYDNVEDIRAGEVKFGVIDLSDCNKCIFPHLRGCPVMGSKNNAACLNLYKSIDTCKAEDCVTCRWLKYCKEKGRNLNKED